MSVFALITAVYHILTVSGLLTFAGIFMPATLSRGISLFFVLTLIYLFVIRDQKSRLMAVLYTTFYILGLTGSAFNVFGYERFLDYGFTGYLDTIGIIAVTFLGISLMGAVKKTAGWALLVLIMVFIVIVRFQNYLPGMLHGQGFTLDRLGYSILVGTGGIFGIPFTVATTIIITFLIFASMMQKCGAGRWFIDLAVSFTGWTRGGPAKASVVASGLMGSISGSATGNVATTGTITIPLMKGIGYSPAFAGGVEAVASTGGIFLPPVMGGIAFIMAEWLGIKYAQVVVAAAIPALLYYLVLFMSVHFAASREKLNPVPREQMQPLSRTLRNGWFYLVPLALLIYLLLVAKYRPETAGLYTIPLLIAVSFLSRDRSCWLGPSKIAATLQDAVFQWAPIAAISAAVGMLIGSLQLSGLGVKFTSFILEISAGNLLITLLLVGLASFILGMGLDSIPVYMTLVILTGPALIKLGVAPIAAHLFIIFFGLASFFTPPVCLAVYVACSISGANIWQTGWQAVRLGAAIFIVPFAFIYGPALLMNGTVGEIAFSAGTALIGGTCLAAALQAYFFKGMAPVERIMVGAGGALMIFSSITYTLVGMGLVFCGLAWNWLKKYKAKSAEGGLYM